MPPGTRGSRAKRLSGKRMGNVIHRFFRRDFIDNDSGDVDGDGGKALADAQGFRTAQPVVVDHQIDVGVSRHEVGFQMGVRLNQRLEPHLDAVGFKFLPAELDFGDDLLLLTDGFSQLQQFIEPDKGNRR
jgi:hypothetical protein